MPTLRQIVDGKTLLSAASPAAKHVATHIQDPFGATKKGVEDLNDARMKYEQQKQNMRMQLAPVKQVVQGIENMHQLNGPGDGSPLDSGPFPDPNADPTNPYQAGPFKQIDESTGLPQNMSQVPGKMNQMRPSQSGFQPGTAPGFSEDQVRPGKMGTPQTGQGQVGTVAGKPGRGQMPAGWNPPGTGSNPTGQQYAPSAKPPKGNRSLPGAKGPGDPKVANRTKKAQSNFGPKGRGISVEVHADHMPIRSVKSNVDNIAGPEKLRTMQSYGTSEGVTKAWDSRGRGVTSHPMRKQGFGGPGAWHQGTAGDNHSFQAKIYHGGSEYGINQGNVSKLAIRDGSGKEVYNYDRGLDHDEAPKGMVSAIVDHFRERSMDAGRSRRMQARDFSQARRKNLAKSGDAMPHGGFPIVNREDLKNAKQAIGRAKNREATVRHINERAKALGAPGFGKSMNAKMVNLTQ